MELYSPLKCYRKSLMPREKLCGWIKKSRDHKKLEDCLVMHANMYVVCSDVCEHACSGEEDPSDMALNTDAGFSCWHSYEVLKFSKMHISDLVIRKKFKENKHIFYHKTWPTFIFFHISSLMNSNITQTCTEGHDFSNSASLRYLNFFSQLLMVSGPHYCCALLWSMTLCVHVTPFLFISLSMQFSHFLQRRTSSSPETVDVFLTWLECRSGGRSLALQSKRSEDFHALSYLPSLQCLSHNHPFLKPRKSHCFLAHYGIHFAHLFPQNAL